MDTNIYNEKVMGLKTKINDLEEDILKDRKMPENLNGFKKLMQESRDIIDAYNEIYNNLPTGPSKNRLLEVFERENAFLVEFFNLMNVLNEYHNRIGFVSDEEIQLEWKNVKTILNYNQLYDQLTKNAEALLSSDGLFGEATELDEKINLLEEEKENALAYMEKLENADERVISDDLISSKKEEENKRLNYIQKSEKEALEAIDYFVERLDDTKENNIQEETPKEIIARKEDIVVNQVYLSTLSTYEEKKAYLELILANIEKLPGRKKTVKFKDDVKRINRYYASYWLKCHSKLQQVEREEELRLQKLEEEYQKIIEKAKKREYGNLALKFRDIEEELFGIANRANAYLGTNQVVAAASFKGEPFYVLKTDLNDFSRVFMKYKRLQHELQEFAKENDFEISMDIERFEEIERKSFYGIHLLELREKLPENLEKIETLKTQFSKACKSKSFATYAGMKTMFHKLAMPEEKSEVLTEILENPFKLLYTKEHTNEEKRNVFSSILTYIEDYTKKFKEQNLEKFSLKSTSVIEKAKRQAKRCAQLLPKKNKKTAKIINIKEAKNREAVMKGCLGIAAAAAIICGTSYISEQTSIVGQKDMSIEASLPSSLNDYHINFDEIAETNDALESISISESTQLSQTTVDNVESLFKEKEEEKAKPTPAPIITPKETHKEEINDELEEIHIEETGQEEYLDFGDEVKPREGAKVYENYVDAANEINGKTAYYNEERAREAGITREAAGFTYEYNGETVFISVKDEDAEAKKNALEANGAHQINVQFENQFGYEGIYLSDDVYTIENGNGMSR